MFKEKSFEEELLAGMESNLKKNAASNNSAKLDAAKNYLLKSAELLKVHNMEKLATELLNCIEGLK